MQVIKKLSLTIADLDIQEDEIADKQALKVLNIRTTILWIHFLLFMAFCPTNTEFDLSGSKAFSWFN